MTRPIYTWILFGLCVMLAAAAMGHVSLTALRLERAESQARREANYEDNVRLALWRMDSKLAPIIAQENARPYFVYFAYYPAERPYRRMLEEIRPDESVVPSPLLHFTSPEILVHFQIDPAGKITSPQVPERPLIEVAGKSEVNFVGDERARRYLQHVRSVLRADELLAALPPPDRELDGVGSSYATALNANAFPIEAQVSQQGEAAQPPAQIAAAPNEQMRKGSAEFSRRSQSYQSLQQIANTSDNRLNSGNRLTQGNVIGYEPPSEIMEGFLRPLWAGDLLLARRVATSHGDYIQGCLLNWPELRGDLLAEIADLLPHADLQAIGTGSGADRPTRMMAALPVRLAPGPIPEEASPIRSPIRITLLVAWACVILAALAVGALLRGAVTLSERRGAFVSAVTHELRTPLTTLRMYTEMLADGMVREEPKRQSYLQTLRVEADRLGHLVENVLAYSRIERGRARGHITDISVAELMSRVQSRLSERAGQAGMNLVIEASNADGEQVRADPSAVEQILFNLVDNACKYAASAPDRTIHLETAAGPEAVFIRVRDNGPGITAEDGRRLFRPFSKSAREAANSAPGVGLGLALSRRLAREMGGELSLEPAAASGASFRLSLPLTRR